MKMQILKILIKLLKTNKIKKMKIIIKLFFKNIMIVLKVIKTHKKIIIKNYNKNNNNNFQMIKYRLIKL